MIAEQIGVPAASVDPTDAGVMVLAMDRERKRGDRTINRFTLQSESTHVVAALTQLSATTPAAIEPLTKEAFDERPLSPAQCTIRVWSARESAERTHTADTAVTRSDG